MNHFPSARFNVRKEKCSDALFAQVPLTLGQTGPSPSVPIGFESSLPTGPVGPTGTRLNDNTTGPTGPDGPRGVDGIFLETSGPTGYSSPFTGSSITGPQGPTGCVAATGPLGTFPDFVGAGIYIGEGLLAQNRSLTGFAEVGASQPLNSPDLSIIVQPNLFGPWGNCAFNPPLYFQKAGNIGISLTQSGTYLMNASVVLQSLVVSKVNVQMHLSICYLTSPFDDVLGLGYSVIPNNGYRFDQYTESTQEYINVSGANVSVAMRFDIPPGDQVVVFPRVMGYQTVTTSSGSLPFSVISAHWSVSLISP
jgi:hypothetical protein